ncbi:nitrogen fixation protein NifQ [Vibrio sp. WXL103]|uniref:nitrogen fixation protein NifQ n=1 Tax=unclassified Vibrio TaxID=2614977 RepID=UPI003EC7E965
MITQQEYHIWSNLLSRFQQGLSRLPNDLGLKSERCQQIRVDLTAIATKQGQSHNFSLRASEKAQVMSNGKHHDIYLALTDVRHQEEQDLSQLLNEHLNTKRQYGRDMVTLLAKASLLPSHLWQILGLESRNQLGELIQFYFPTLFAKNTLNMRWKRFFYKQLCDQGGDYVCRAPNCLHCSSFKECFVT